MSVSRDVRLECKNGENGLGGLDPDWQDGFNPALGPRDFPNML